MNLNECVAVVTGGATGVGRALALRAARSGATVVVADISDAGETVRLIQDMGGTAVAVSCDVTDPAAVATLVERTETEFGQVNLVCANAGTSTGGGTIDKAALEDFRKIFELNVFGVFNVSSAFLSLLKSSAAKGQAAAILITGSEHSLAVPSTSPPLIAYTSSKHALVGFAGCCRRDLAGTGVQVSLLCPGWVRTETLMNYASSNKGLAQIMTNYGQEPAEVAELAFEGMARGALIIPTNPSSREDGLHAHAEILEAITALPHGSI
jgi:NAD(P)-dependent dehydrogenase (short-subunit alcohol dehydrogenase family)